MSTETKKDILAIVFFVLAVLSFLSFFNSAGIFGEHLVRASRILFGKGFFFIAISFLLASLAFLLPRLKLNDRKQPHCKIILAGVALLGISAFGIFSVISARMFLGSDFLSDKMTFKDAFLQGTEASGYLGMAIGYPLVRFFSFWASLIILTALLIVSALVSFNIPLIPKSLRKEKEGEDRTGESIITHDTLDAAAESAGQEERKGLWGILKKKAVPAAGGSASASPSGGGISADESPASAGGVSLSGAKKSRGGFKFPPFDFLEKDQGKPTSGDIKANINIIKRTLENFGIEVEMAEVNVGPTVTQYTFRPAQGVKLTRITALQNDLALALAAHPLRIEAPIPGRSLVGVEIPNKSIVMVRLRSLLEKAALRSQSPTLAFALGRDVAGNPVFADLSKMPHLLVAGATGAGKTISLNNLVVSLLYHNSPDDLKLMMIDPKRVELTAYESIPHLLSPVIVQAEKAAGSLRWAVAEMERRFSVLQSAGKRDIVAYNGGRKEGDEKLPYIIIVIDELADLMTSHGRDVEASIVRLAQMARAVGLHLVVSTQRPSVEVITGLIKANITSRVAFQVASQVDSRTILDMAGAEKLLGRGDMLFLAGNSAKPMRVQGVYISDKEVKAVTDYLRQVQGPEFKNELTSIQEGGRVPVDTKFAFATGDDAGDELYGEAKKVVIQAKKASASLLQRRLRVGYARAARLLDVLEEKGVVGPANGAKPRDVFIDEGEDMKIG